MNEKLKFFRRGLSYGLLLLLSLLCACSSLTIENPDLLLVKLPDFNLNQEVSPEFPRVKRWLVQIYGEDGRDSFFVDESEFNISLRKNRLTAITAFPLTALSDCTEDIEKEVLFFSCAGAILPYCSLNKSDSVDLQLTWEDGFSAYILQRLFSGSELDKNLTADFLLKFNWNKLLDLVRSKIENSFLEFENSDTCDGICFYNPWLLDVENIVQKIADGTFTASCLNLKGILSFDCLNCEAVVCRGRRCPLSAFVLENTVIQAYGRLSVKKNEINLFMIDGLKGILVSGNKEKNLSVKSIYMPIFCKGYEYSE
ncbi:MAG: hypothetical protein K5829_05385 [Treponema sp.]|nr:hypothetical protein [Treponema sp.]